MPGNLVHFEVKTFSFFRHGYSVTNNMKAHRKKRQQFFWTFQARLCSNISQFLSDIFFPLFVLDIDLHYTMQVCTLAVSEQKISPHNGTRARKSLFEGRGARNQPELNSKETKSETILRAEEAGDHRPC